MAWTDLAPVAHASDLAALREAHEPERHPSYKTEPCRPWEAAGHCRAGASCSFAHGDADRRQLPTGAAGACGGPVPCLL